MARLNFVEARDARGRQAPRRGIVLLFVLALLALFSLVTVTYVLVARQAKIGALVSSRVEQTGNTGQTNSQLDFALLQVLRGTNSPNSVMGPHSLLEDMYGSDGVVGTVVDGMLLADGVTNADNPRSSRLLPAFTFGTQGQEFLVQLDVNTDVPMYLYDGAYNGRTVTMLTGGAAGRSSRVLDSKVAVDESNNRITDPSLPAHNTPNLIGSTHVLRVMQFGATVSVGDRVLINGAAFNGTGFGFGFATVPPPAPPMRPTETLFLGALDTSIIMPTPLTPPVTFPYALLPNNSAFRMNASVVPRYEDWAGPGGADEAYDAVDYQNMLLALYVADAQVDGEPTSVPVPIPSLHRPELIYYWLRKTQVIPDSSPGVPSVAMADVTETHLRTLETVAPGLLRRIMLRPNPVDHPNFTGGNPSFRPCSLGVNTLNPTVGHWDVDNDQDGVHDSIWVDLGAPVLTAADGKRFKALYSLLVVDEDSRLNANTAGSLAHFDTNSSPIVPIDVRDPVQGFRAGPYAGTDGTGIRPVIGVPNTPYLSMGQGYGPAEINIAVLFDEPPSTVSNALLMRNEAFSILAGGPTPSNGTLEGRYGEVSGWSAGPPVIPAPGTTGVPFMDTDNPKLSTGDWLDDLVRSGDMSYDYFFASRTTIPVGRVPPRFGSYGSPPDLNGDGALGLDLRGQPWYGDVLNDTDPAVPGKRPLPSDTPVVPNYRYFAGFGEWHSSTWNDKLDDPYEMNLTVYSTAFQPGVQQAHTDRPYGPTDLERLRRFNDVDASSLSNRLTALAPETLLTGANANPLDAARRRSLLTTASWDTPVPSTILTPELVTDLLQSTPETYTFELNVTAGLVGGNAFVNSGTNLSYLELIRRRLTAADFDLTALDPNFNKQNQIHAFRQLVSWDLARGERLDLNRPLGNGVDDDDDNYLDNEATNGDVMWSAIAVTPSSAPFLPLSGPFMDANNDGIFKGSSTESPSLADTSDGLARQLLARHLYVLAWSVVDPTQFYPTQPGTPPLVSSRDALAPLVNSSLTPKYATASPPYTPPAAVDLLKARAAIARRLAQWAVNMVDFRDRDSVMTGFEYDVDPFNDVNSDGFPWDVDDDLSTTSDPAATAPPSTPAVSARGVVWGCERPELLITETLAVHDRRTQDTASDTENENKTTTDPAPKDTDFDQTYRPVGTLLVELFAPWNQTEMPAPELYDPPASGTNRWKLDLARRNHVASVGPPFTTDGSPIWRLAIVDGSPLLEATPNLTNSDASRDANLDIKRLVYFTDGTNLPADYCTKHFFRETAIPLPMPVNGYAVIGPEDAVNAADTLNAGQTKIRKKTAAGTDVILKYTAAPPAPPAVPPPPSFEITTTLVPPYPKAEIQIKTPIGVIINKPRRLSISEPYKDGVTLTKYDDWDNQIPPPTNLDTPPSKINDIPWDSPAATPQNLDVPPRNGTNGENPISPNIATFTSTHRTIFLQRLANPTQPWHPLANPYISVDRMPVDLTVYNSLDSGDLDPTTQVSTANGYKFGSRQRGVISNHPVVTDRKVFDIWANGNVGPTDPTQMPTTYPGTDIQRTTFGFLNDVAQLHYMGTGPIAIFRMRKAGATTPAPDVNVEMDTPTGVGDEFIGDPSVPFPWLTWNNRPYISKHELLLVPALGPTELLSQHAARNPFSGNADSSPYLLPGQGLGSYTALDVFTGLQYGYVSPLLMSSWLNVNDDPPATTPPPTPPPLHQFSLPNFHRLLEFVTVPSRFAGTEAYLDAKNFSAVEQSTVPPLNEPSGHRFNPPFNRISALREPGKININTVTDLKVWQAIMNNLPDGSPAAWTPMPANAPSGWTSADAPPSSASWLKVLASRRGYGFNLPTNWLVVDSSRPPQTASATGAMPLPTFFTNPFRSYGGLYLQPLPELQIHNFNVGPGLAVPHPSDPNFLAAPPKVRFWQNEIDATLLRVDQSGFAGDFLPLFAQNPGAADTAAFADAFANPYFHYQNIQKLSNLVTTRSNVYAVWITVGYFEVSRVPVDTGHPDGWALGAEMGLDSGKVERHRAFYIIDRSLPVAFQRGQDNNVDNAVLLRRVIE